MRPFPNETPRSYLRRLARVNALSPDHVTRIVTAHGRGRRDTIAALSGIPAAVLTTAMPQLTDGPEQAPAHARPAGPERAACRRCAHRRCPEHPYPMVTRRHEDVLCHKHRMWLGDTVSPQRQLLLGDLYPELAAAARRHRHLILRHGRSAVLDAYYDARQVILAYADQGVLPNCVTHRWGVLWPQAGAHNLSTLREVSTYPSSIALTAIMTGMPRGRQWAALSPEQIHAYRCRVATEVTAGYPPSGVFDAFNRTVATPSRHIGSDVR